LEAAVTLIDDTTAVTHLPYNEEWEPSELRRVVIRLAGGEVVQLGTAPNRQSALVLARTFIAEIEEPQGEWPVVGDRMLRPDSIVSVDILTNT
jgi:hypothetical protein